MLDRFNHYSGLIIQCDTVAQVSEILNSYGVSENCEWLRDVINDLPNFCIVIKENQGDYLRWGYDRLEYFQRRKNVYRDYLFLTFEEWEREEGSINSCKEHIEIDPIESLFEMA